MSAAHDMARSRGFLSADEVDAIQALAREMIGSVVVDLGAGAGTTALAVLEANDEALVYTVDHDPANLDWARIAITNAGYRERWVPVYGKSWEPMAVAPDLLLVDASHEFEDVMRDIQEWVPRTTGGFVWFDDYVGTGVAVAVDYHVASGAFEIELRVDKSVVVRLRDN